MTADLARVTYDPTRQYRAVISQQGRVTLEADNNEAATIASEALRVETIDVVGPTGTLNNGYAPGSGTGAGGVSIGPGVFYLGGWRLELDAKIDLSSQPDWLDAPVVTIATGNLLVALLLNEQSVSAVEDQALREVALGGPDSAARSRLMQHFLRLPLNGNTCGAGATMLAQQLALDGVSIDPARLQLVSQARLQAGFVPGPAITDPCTPTAAGGYLGADNQVVRVTVIAYDATAKTGTLLWGWNNASILYRAGMTDPLTLTLPGTPVDGEHAPQLGQAVEILRSEANLGDGNFIAAAQGFVTTVAQAYSFDTGEVGLTDPLPAEYQADKNPLFIRLWQAKVPFTASQVTALDNVSGLTVTISLPVLPSRIALRPFWRFAVRPSTPVQIYPQRYLEGPQPPEGPRQWITDIAVLAAQASGSTLVQDCRVPFVPLTQQQSGRCCTLVLGPNDVAARGGLQAVLDGAAGTATGVSLLPGTYPLAAPLVLTNKHNGLVLEGCGGNAILEASADTLAPFAFGLIELIGAPGITLRRLVLQMPVVPVGTARLSVGVLASASPSLTIDQCSFQATVGTATTSAFGLIVTGEGTGLAVRRSRFTASSFVAGGQVFGIVGSASSATVTTSLDNAEISDNTFDSLGAAVVTFSELGLVRCTNNRVTGCGTGLYFADSNLAAATEVARQALTELAQPGMNATLALALTNDMQASMLAGVVTSMAQFDAKAPQPPSPPVVSEATRTVMLQDIAARGGTAWRAVALPPPTPVAGAPAPPAAPPLIAQALSDTISKSLDAMREIAIGVTVAGVSHTPLLHISGNDVSLASVVAAPAGVATTGVLATGAAATHAAAIGTSATGAATTGAAATGAAATTGATATSPGATGAAATGAATGVPGVGIAVVLSPRDAAGTVLMTANRVLTADARTAAGAVLYPAAAAVTGNVFIQTGAGKDSVPAFLLVAEQTAPFEVMANVIVANALIVPPRATTAATTSWNFLNTAA